MSPLLSSLLTAAGGVLAGLALAGALLWHQHRALRRARYDATHDDLTGLANRRAVLAHLTARQHRSQPTGVVLLDLDRFKVINDTFSHDDGNDVLAQVAERLARLPGARPGLAARLSGDEFLLIVHGDAGATRLAANAAWQAIARAPIRVGEHRIPLTASVGLAMTRLGISATELIHHADLAMYRAKTTGVAVCAYTPSTDETHRPGPRYRSRSNPPGPPERVPAARDARRRTGEPRPPQRQGEP